MMSSDSGRQSGVSFSPSVDQGFQASVTFPPPTPQRKPRRADPLDFSTPPSAQPQRDVQEDTTSSSGTSSSTGSEEIDGLESNSRSGSEDSSGEETGSSHNESKKSITGLLKRFEDDLNDVAKVEVELWERSTPHNQKLANNIATPQKLRAKMQAKYSGPGELDDFHGYPPTPGSTKKRSMQGAKGVKPEDTDDYDGYESNAGYHLAIGPSSMLFGAYEV